MRTTKKGEGSNVRHSKQRTEDSLEQMSVGIKKKRLTKNVIWDSGPRCQAVGPTKRTQEQVAKALTIMYTLG